MKYNYKEDLSLWLSGADKEEILPASRSLDDDHDDENIDQVVSYSIS